LVTICSEDTGGLEVVEDAGADVVLEDAGMDVVVGSTGDIEELEEASTSLAL
jgi:hypothetical protein